MSTPSLQCFYAGQCPAPQESPNLPRRRLTQAKRLRPARKSQRRHAVSAAGGGESLREATASAMPAVPPQMPPTRRRPSARSRRRCPPLRSPREPAHVSGPISRPMVPSGIAVGHHPVRRVCSKLFADHDVVGQHQPPAGPMSTPLTSSIMDLLHQSVTNSVPLCLEQREAHCRLRSAWHPPWEAAA